MTRSKQYLFIALSLMIVINVGMIMWRYHQPKTSNTVTVKPTSFSALPDWTSANMSKSLDSFQLSCERFVRQNPEKTVGNNLITLQVKDWLPACKQALAMKNATPKEAKLFFQQWFKPVTFDNGQAITGLFTGYYLPEIKASLVKTAHYTVPIYQTPRNLLRISLTDFDANLPKRDLYGRLDHRQLVPYYSRADIDKGAIAENAAIIAFIHSPIERVFMEIQGSGILTLEDGSHLYLGYAGKNGLPYTAIGRTLLERGILEAKDISLQSIQAYLETHLDERDDIINTNRSFVFFKILDKKGAFGTQGAKLTPGYSMAVDPNWVPLGVPVWLDTTRPDHQSESAHPLHRLLIAQDTGGAIKGVVRGDVFWGAGPKNAAIAGKMKNHGRYWLLLPLTSPNPA